MLKKILTALVMTFSLSIFSIANVQSAPINITPSSAYQFEQHDNFQVFWSDLQKAVSQNDRIAVSKMLNYPFSDYEHSPMIFQNASDFLSHYDELFNAKMIKLIATNSYRQGDSAEEQEQVPDATDPDGYVIEHENSDDGYNLVIEKVDGIYKIVRIAFYS